MGQVLKQDLTSGKLLSLDEDLPQLLKATDAASEAMRGLIRDLRVSPLGSGGLARTLRLLVNHLAALTSARFVLDLEDVGGSSVTQLLAYQIAREALTNAARHAEANVIRLRLSASEGYMRLLVQDDGRGFDPASVNRNQHFGLQLMRDRAELVEGLILVDSAPGRGTTVVARVLLEPGI
jgi:signal transduction histidine kinase